MSDECLDHSSLITHHPSLDLAVDRAVDDDRQRQDEEAGEDGDPAVAFAEDFLGHVGGRQPAENAGRAFWPARGTPVGGAGGRGIDAGEPRAPGGAGGRSCPAVGPPPRPLPTILELYLARRRHPRRFLLTRHSALGTRRSRASASS